MADPHIITALVRKRAELAGEIAEMERQLRFARADIAHVDGCLVLFGYRHSRKGIKPIKPRQDAIFKHGQLKRMVLDIRRETGRPMTNRQIAAEVIRRMGWTETDQLLVAITVRVKDVTKRLPDLRSMPPVANSRTNCG